MRRLAESSREGRADGRITVWGGRVNQRVQELGDREKERKCPGVTKMCVRDFDRRHREVGLGETRVPSPLITRLEKWDG